MQTSTQTFDFTLFIKVKLSFINQLKLMVLNIHGVWHLCVEIPRARFSTLRRDEKIDIQYPEIE